MVAQELAMVMGRIVARTYPPLRLRFTTCGPSRKYLILLMISRNKIGIFYLPFLEIVLSCLYPGYFPAGGRLAPPTLDYFSPINPRVACLPFQSRYLARLEPLPRSDTRD